MTIPSNCYEYVELLDAYLDNELDAAEKSVVDSHLASCPACVRELERIKRLQLGLKTLPRLTPSRDIDFSFLDAAPAHAQVNECAPIIPLLDAYYDLELAADEKKLVEKHLASCMSCSEHLAQIPRLVMGLKVLPQLAPSRDIVGSINFSALALPSKTKVCADFFELLDGYHDNELSPAEKVDVETHVTACADCAAGLRGIAKIAEELKALPRFSPPRDIVGAVEFEQVTMAVPAFGAQASESKANGSPAVAATASDKQASASSSTRSNVLPFGRKQRFGLLAVAAAAVAMVFAINFKSPGLPGNQIAFNPNPVSGVSTVSGTAKPANETSTAEKNELAALPENPDTKGPVAQATPAGAHDESMNNAKSSSSPKQVIASRLGSDVPETTAVQHEALPNDLEKNTDTANEMAVLPDSGNSAGAGADALGIGTDEDGLYDIKI